MIRSEFEKRSHKPMRFGETTLDLDPNEFNMNSINLLGVQIDTDYQELTTISKRCTTDDPPPQLCLTYLVNSPLPFVHNDNYLIAPITPDYAGEIYVDYTLQNYGFSGIPSFGTLSHIIYGIRAFESIQEGILGVHSALIYDRELNGYHLLVGPSKAGKSTLGGQLEIHDSSRFTMLGDDWVEIDMETQKPQVISPFMSTPSTSTEEPLFVSFKKPYYKKPEFTPIPDNNGIISTILLHPESNIDENEFITKSMSPIPFIISDNISELEVPDLHQGSSQSHLIGLIEYRIALYREIFRKLVKSRNSEIIINDHSRSVDDMTQDLLNIINKQ